MRGKVYPNFFAVRHQNKVCVKGIGVKTKRGGVGLV